jgi:hypothetical protein
VVRTQRPPPCSNRMRWSCATNAPAGPTESPLRVFGRAVMPFLFLLVIAAPSGTKGRLISPSTRAPRGMRHAPSHKPPAAAGRLPAVAAARARRRLRRGCARHGATGRCPALHGHLLTAARTLFAQDQPEDA